MAEQTITGPMALESHIEKTWNQLEPLNSVAVSEALKAAGMEIHTFSGNGGCDVPTSSVLESIETYGARKGSEEYLFMKMGMILGHELAIIDHFGRIILVELSLSDLPTPSLVTQEGP